MLRKLTTLLLAMALNSYGATPDADCNRQLEGYSRVEPVTHRRWYWPTKPTAVSNLTETTNRVYVEKNEEGQMVLTRFPGKRLGMMPGFFFWDMLMKPDGTIFCFVSNESKLKVFNESYSAFANVVTYDGFIYSITPKVPQLMRPGLDEDENVDNFIRELGRRGMRASDFGLGSEISLVDPDAEVAARFSLKEFAQAFPGEHEQALRKAETQFSRPGKRVRAISRQGQPTILFRQSHHDGQDTGQPLTSEFLQNRYPDLYK